MNKAVGVLGLVGALIAAGPAVADDDDWIGVYLGVDAADGSMDYLSIVPGDDDTFAITIAVSAHGMCPGTGAAVVHAAGRLDGDRLVREEGTLTCAGADAVAHPGTVYELGKNNRYVAAPAPNDGRKLHFHRLSSVD